MNVTRLESTGSWWELDDDLGRYRRWPKQEGPREDPSWGDERAGALQDGVWHPMDRWAVEETQLGPRLRIYGPDGVLVTAPMPGGPWDVFGAELEWDLGRMRRILRGDGPPVGP